MLLATAEAPVVSRHAEFEVQPGVEQTRNARLRELVATSGLPPAVAMTIFNRQRGSAACSETEWRGFMAEPGSGRYREMSSEQFAHAVAQFARIDVHREQG